jgi:hypothetical protein
LHAPVPAEIWNRVQQDGAATEIAGKVLLNLNHDVINFARAPGGALLHLKTIETFSGKVRYLWRRAVQPNQLDREFVRLPESLSKVYYLVRPLRVACVALGRLRSP